MDYHANVEGVCWFCREILSDLLATYPDLQFYIVGRDPAPAVKKLAAMQGVHVIGDVADVRPWYQQAEVFVVPLRLGRGVQNKVLEAMAMGKPVVSTSRANAGVSANDNEHLLLADSAAGFADAVRALLQDNEKRKMLGHRARNFVQAEYDWDINMAKLESLLA
jgi:glycosyltransferase involved in cell wall biosynthesis